MTSLFCQSTLNFTKFVHQRNSQLSKSMTNYLPSYTNFLSIRQVFLNAPNLAYIFTPPILSLAETTYSMALYVNFSSYSIFLSYASKIFCTFFLSERLLVMALFPRLADCSHFHYENSGVTQFKVNFVFDCFIRSISSLCLCYQLFKHMYAFVDSILFFTKVIVILPIRIYIYHAIHCMRCTVPM